MFRIYITGVAIGVALIAGVIGFMFIQQASGFMQPDEAVALFFMSPFLGLFAALAYVMHASAKIPEEQQARREDEYDRGFNKT